MGAKAFLKDILARGCCDGRFVVSLPSASGSSFHALGGLKVYINGFLKPERGILPFPAILRCVSGRNTRRALRTITLMTKSSQNMLLKPHALLSNPPMIGPRA